MECGETEDCERLVETVVEETVVWWKLQSAG